LLKSLLDGVSRRPGDMQFFCAIILLHTGVEPDVMFSNTV